VNISVIIPVRNEEQSIRQLLDSLENQTLKPSEIIISDGGSTDKTPEIVAEYQGRSIPIRLIRAGPAFPGRGRNLAASQTENEWLAMIDAGVKPEPTWLESLARTTQSISDVDVVYGAYEPVADTLFKRCAVMAYVPPPVEVQGKLVRTRSVASMMLRRSVWHSVGGFPENLRSAEDLLYLNKIEQANFSVAHAPEALVHWQVQPNPWLTFKRFVSYSHHNIRAGLWRQWQAAIFKRYLMLLIVALPALKFGTDWWLVVVAGLWLALLSARAAVSIWRNHVCYPGGILDNCARMTVLVPIIALLDAATIVGTIQWAIKDKLGFSHTADRLETSV
jgi:glycosyltransferase involved in cell wall biosynthesis